MRLFFLIVFLLISETLAHQQTCGTDKIIQYQNQIKSGLLSRTIAVSSLVSCEDEAYYNHLDTILTKHFIIYYTLEGPHATTQFYLDTLAFYLEKAWYQNTTLLGMLPPKGMKISYHYKQEVPNDLYPVEVIDIDLLRNTNIIMGEPCRGCYGLTYPDIEDNERSTLIIDNDFKYTSINAPISIITDSTGKECTYPSATMELYNTSQTPYSYFDYPEKALKITAFHELYHASQIRYVETNSFFSFWYEASAVGVEEIGAKEVNDYWSYLTSLFRYPETFPSTPLDNGYKASVLYLYFYKQNGPLFDASLWDAFSKNTEKSFTKILSEQLLNRELDPDSSFHDFVQKLFFSGFRAKYQPSENLLYEDSPDWPNMSIQEASSNSIVLSTLSFRYLSVKSEIPDLNSFKGKASLLLWNENEEDVTIETISHANDLFLLNSSISESDSAVLILSRFMEDAPAIQTNLVKTLRAFPTPWQGSSPLCFTPLPETDSFIEIRNRIGTLVSRIQTNSTTHCLEASYIKSKMTPGLYHFRIGSHGKTTPFILIY